VNSRTQFITVAAVALAALVGIWLAGAPLLLNAGRDQPTHLTDATQVSDTKLWTGKGHPPHYLSQTEEELEAGEPELTYSNLTLGEANQALRKLFGFVMPSSSKMVNPGHFAMAPSDAKSLIETMEARRLQDSDGIKNQSEWIEFSSKRLDGARRPKLAVLSWTASVDIPAGSHVFTLTPAWHGEMIPRFDLWIDPGSGLCLFNKLSNYDP
jgi:hypothetical protein